MQRAFTKKAFVLLTMLFVLFAAISFAAFRQTEKVCRAARNTCSVSKPAKSSEVLWEVVSRQFLSLVSL
jgi:hypothetical protein